MEAYTHRRVSNWYIKSPHSYNASVLITPMCWKSIIFATAFNIMPIGAMT